MNRVVSVDAARGFAIILVIIGHAVAVPVQHGFTSPKLMMNFWQFFEPFRMPLLLFLSGILLPRSLKKRPGVFLSGKVRLILWPYLVWALIRYVPDFGSISVSHPDVWLAAGYLWFLFFLLGYYLIALVLSSLPYWVVAVGCFALSFVLDGGWEKFVFHAVYFFMGASVVSLSPDMQFLRNRWVQVVASAAALVTGFLSVSSGGGEVPRFGLPAVVCCIFATIALFQWLEVRSELKFLQWVGRNSIVFYTSHFPIVSAVVSGLALSGITSGSFTWAISAVIALLGGIGMTLMRRQKVIRLLFEGPGGRKHAAAESAQRKNSLL